MAKYIPQPRAFHRLPDEILIMIMEKLLQEHHPGIRRCRIDFPNLKNLRLATRRFAALPQLLSILFNGVRPVASPDHVRILETTELSTFEPYVKRIVFEPTKFTWGMTFQNFKEIAEFIEIKRLAEKREQTLTAWHARKLEKQEILDRCFGGNSPVDEGAVRRDYDAFISEATEVRDLFNNGVLESAWIKALRQLPALDAFKIGKWRFDSKSQQGGHDHGRMHNELECRRAHAPVGDALERAAIAALAGAKSKIRQLSVKHVSTGEFPWADDGRLDQIDLSEMHALFYCPRGSQSDCNPGDDDQERERNRHLAFRYGHALNEVLKRAPSLRLFNFMPQGKMDSVVFPVDSPASLPILDSFQTDAQLSMSNCGNFLSKCSKLKSVEFNCCGGGTGTGTWRDIWRAIRYHSSRMHVRTDQIQCYDEFELSFECDTDMQNALELESDGDIIDHIDASLSNYLANKGKWNASCREFFEGDDAELGVVSEEDDIE